MQPNIQGEDTTAAPASPIFNTFRIASLVVLAVLLSIVLTFAWFTRDAMSSLSSKNRPAKATTASTLIQPWQTAVDLASLAVTAEEQQFAHNAEAMADHEVHQAFQAALNQAQLDVQKSLNQPDARRLSEVLNQRQQTVNQDQSIIKSLTQNNAQEASGDLDLVTAQLDLDTDELKDAQQALARALNDQRGELEQELSAHEAAVKKYNSDLASKSLSALATSKHYGTLLELVTAWRDQVTRYQAIEQAADQTEAKAALLSESQNQAHKPAAKAPPDVTASDNTSRMNAMKRASMYKRQQLISSDRVDSLKRLTDTYRKWAAQVLIQHGIIFHLLMQSLAILVLILFGTLVVDTTVRYFFDHKAAATAKLGRRQYSVRVILRLALQVIAALGVFLLIFGPPSQLATVLGLATAGLTVVLQDFIISFCGWFVLMGQRGIRVGDWVEINGIAGEVAEIGIFRTALLETGNWTDRGGQPTGRHITLANSFAIKGQYFNFTTNGQWMWDELTVAVPAADAYGTIELIDKVVLEETKADSELAEDEWRRTGLTRGLSDISTQASVHMRPGGSGIDIVVRYVTRASNRYAVRNLLNLRILDVIHKPATG